MNLLLKAAILAGLLVLPVACRCKNTTPGPANTPASQPAATPAAGESIGAATMKPDGTIVLQLRAQTGSTVGDALFSYAPGHAKYNDVLKHLGGLKPGESKPVPPWPDKQ